MSKIENDKRPAHKNTMREEPDDRPETEPSEAPKVSHDFPRAANAPTTILSDEGIHVNYEQLFEGLEVFKDVPSLFSPGSEVPQAASSEPLESNEEVSKNSKSVARVFGLRIEIFWCLIILAFIIFGGAVAGGVGAGLARRNQSEKEGMTKTLLTARSSSLIDASR